MAKHNWKEIDWDEEFDVAPDYLAVEGVGALEAGDEVTIRFVVEEVRRYSDSEYFCTKLCAAKPHNLGSWWQRLTQVIGKRDI